MHSSYPIHLVERYKGKLNSKQGHLDTQIMRKAFIWYLEVPGTSQIEENRMNMHNKIQ